MTAVATVRHVVMFSGGIGSYAAARAVIARFGAADVTLLFADTLIEDEDLYRFLADAGRALGVPVTRIAEGRDPWQVFRDVRFLGNSRVDPCSRVLKRDFMDAWLRSNCDPAQTVCYVGIDSTERHRADRLIPRKKAQGWTFDAPLLWPEYEKLGKFDFALWLKEDGVEAPRLYSMGFPHNNCGGFCVKSGQANFALLLKHFPDRYRHHEREEEKIRAKLGDVAILTDRRGGVRRPLPLAEFRERIKGGAPHDAFDYGGCGCAIDDQDNREAQQ